MSGSRPARRLRAVALGAALGLLAGALALGLRDPASDAPAQAVGLDAAELAELRAAAALEPCPAGLGPELPDLELPCLGGGPDVPLRAHPPGRPTLVNLWGTWCAPCVEEVPDLVAFAERAGDRVGVVGVLTTDTHRNGLEFARQFGMRYPNLVDDDRAVLRRFGQGAPVTLFLDAAGAVVHVQHGAFDDLAEIEALVAEHLGVVL